MKDKFDQYFDALQRHAKNPDNIWIHRYFLEYAMKIESLQERIKILENVSYLRPLPLPPQEKENVDS